VPYILGVDRTALVPPQRAKRRAKTAGELNFVITKTVNQYLLDHEVSYQTLNECVGVLECAKLELYRRIAAPYEDLKCNQNGDVYSPGVKNV
jgi:hypothetical protein